MFKINDVLIYGQYGVCKIVDIRNESFGESEKSLYYVLHPIYDEQYTIYTPVDSKIIKMRKLLSFEDIYELIKIIPDETSVWIENDQQRRDTFNKIIKSGNHKDLIKLIKTIYYRREDRNRSGKKLHASDEKTMKDAEKLLYEEFAYVLNIGLDEVVPFILGTLQTSQ